MSRSYGDVVDVVRLDAAPAQFRWRERWYDVEDVLTSWVEAGQWWRAAPAAALVAGEAGGPAAALALSSLPPSPKWAQRAWGEPAPDVGVSVGPASVDDQEREFWRVQTRAVPGRAAGGVFDLCFDWSRGSWLLVRVQD